MCQEFFSESLLKPATVAHPLAFKWIRILFRCWKDRKPTGITGIVFGARGHEGLAAGGRHGRGHGEQDQVRVRQKQVHDRSSLLFQGHGDGLAGEAAMQVGDPDRDGFGRIVNDALFSLAAAGGLENPSMFLASPVEADEPSPGWFWGGNGGIRHVPNSFPEGLAWFHESLIVESRNGKLLSIRFWNQAHPAARTAPRRHRTARRRNS